MTASDTSNLADGSDDRDGAPGRGLVPVFHLVTGAEWAGRSGPWRPPSLAADGFIHLSLASQVDGVVARYFAGWPPADLLVIRVDLSAVDGMVRWEAPPGRPGERYPHLYAQLDESAILAVSSLPGWRAEIGEKAERGSP